MLKLHGLPISNYYNMVKLTLLEKGVEFEELTAVPSQQPELLAQSPRGKVPFLETDQGFLSETITLMEYIEDLHPEPPLYPLDPYQSGVVRQLIQLMELYVELPARKLLSHVVFGGELSDHHRKEALDGLELGLPAVQRVARFAPYIAGDQFTSADIFAYYTGMLAGFLTEKVYGENLMLQLEGYSEWRELIAERPLVQRVDSDHGVAMADFLANK
ncbi:glutathione S-transferase [Porticoccus sp. W117]|uniref:glutathione S-transferase family protein n=1 Tax=Porticoccus sp. W117 TaxID=3054777 RepID=UPI0025973880|nr:glutathione S-transferase [Porticoccus sp. W117]MDM3871105.1 glutathione S-transferase [Porticoccus sp. W117]